MEMNEATLYGVVLAVIGLLGGAFGSKLLDRWSEQARIRAKADGDSQSGQFTDSEQARKWLREQLAERDAKLEERDAEIRELRVREMALLERVGHLAEAVARQEERLTSQAQQLTALGASVAKVGGEYQKMEAERDRYRDEKHDAVSALTAESLRRQMADRELAARDEEIARLKGQLAAMAGSKEAA
jgi:chromosome segregation ATPase